VTLHPADVKDEELRALLEAANAALDEGRNRACVERCAEAYLRALKKFPPLRRGLERSLANEEVKAGIEAGVIRVAPFMWPRFAAKLDMSGAEPRITFDRASVSFTEAIQYYEFTLNIIVEAEKGEFTNARRFAGQGA
jgi:hypothetical protein